MTDLIAEILRLSRRMRLEAGRGPSAAELAGYLHLPLAEVRDALARAKDLAARELAGEGAAGGPEVPGGLSEALTIEEEQALCRRFGIGDAPGRSAEEQLRREEKALRMRFGIAMSTETTLEEIGRQFAVTRERIRRIEAKALRKPTPKGPEET